MHQLTLILSIMILIQSLKISFSYIGVAVFLAGFALMTLQIPFPHHVNFIDVIYMHSLSMVLILFGSIFLFIIILIYYQILKNLLTLN